MQQQDKPKPITIILESGPGLTFDALRRANMARLPRFRNRLGAPAHSEPDGSDWSYAAWGNATAGEIGEMLVEFGRFLQLCDTLKKLERGDLGELEAARVRIGGEAADIVTYLDITCARLGIDLGAATLHKFNAVTERVGAEVWLE